MAGATSSERCPGVTGWPKSARRSCSCRLWRTSSARSTRSRTCSRRRCGPEFAKAGKADMPVRSLLTHQAGLPVIDEQLPANAVLDWDVMVGALERQAPVWAPGSTQGYHAVTFGWLVGEVVRRVAKSPS